jgi:hypothetical protein
VTPSINPTRHVYCPVSVPAKGIIYSMVAPLSSATKLSKDTIPSPEYENARPRNSIGKWYIIEGLQPVELLQL